MGGKHIAWHTNADLVSYPKHYSYSYICHYMVTFVAFQCMTAKQVKNLPFLVVKS